LLKYRTRLKVGVFLGLILLSGSLSFASQPVPEKRPVRFGAWVTYWDFAAGVEAVIQNPSVFKDVYFFSTVLAPDGKPIMYNPDLPYASVVATLKGEGIRTWLTVVNDVVKPNRRNSKLKDPDLIHSILQDDKRRALHRQALIRLTLQYGFDGIDVDYENLHAKDKEIYTQFIRELNDDVKHHGLKLSVTVQPKDREKKSRGPGATDWQALCNYTDQVQIMLYNLHNCKTGPGPMATIPWMNSIMNFGLTRCSIDKLVPVLKVSGMRWSENRCEGLQYKNIIPLLTAHTEIVQRTSEETPYLKYIENGNNYTIYYEDTKSLLEKIIALRALGYHRITFWSLGRHDFSLHKALRNQ